MLEVEGEGWNEAFLPTIKRAERVIERCADPSQSYRSRLDRDVNAVVNFLSDHCDLTRDAASKVLDEASMWQKTKEGRPLIDRRRRKRVLRNIPGVVATLVAAGVPLSGPKSVGAMLTANPNMLHLRTGNSSEDVDEIRTTGLPDTMVWETRYVALCGFYHMHGHADIPKEWPVVEGMNKWMEKQVFMAARGMLGPEKRTLLSRAGVETGYVTPEWEAAFDALLDFHAVTGHFDVPPSLRLTFSDEGSATYVYDLDQSQMPETLAEFVDKLRKKRDTLPKNVLERLHKVGFTWDSKDIPSGEMATSNAVRVAITAGAHDEENWEEVVPLIPSISTADALSSEDEEDSCSSFANRLRQQDMLRLARENRDILMSIDDMDDEEKVRK